MSSVARFTENETGTEVSVETVFGWEPWPLVCLVKYPSGRTYALPEGELSKHFTIITPQEIPIRAYGIDDRPTKQQRALREAGP